MILTISLKSVSSWYNLLQYRYIIIALLLSVKKRRIEKYCPNTPLRPSVKNTLTLMLRRTENDEFALVCEENQLFLQRQTAKKAKNTVLGEDLRSFRAQHPHWNSVRSVYCKKCNNFQIFICKISLSEQGDIEDPSNPADLTGL